MESFCFVGALNLPNLLTLTRIALLPVVVWMYRGGNAQGALAVYLLAMLTDAADGTIARRTGQITALGKLLDPLADKLTLLTLLSMFALEGQIPLWLVNMLLAKELILIAGSAAALRCGIVVSALPIGKATTLVFISSTAFRFAAMRAWADRLLWVCAGLSLVSLFWYSAVLAIRLSSKRAICQKTPHR